MSRVVMTGLMAMSIVLTACQQERLSSNPPPKAVNSVNTLPPVGNPLPPVNVPPPPPPPVNYPPPPVNTPPPIYTAPPTVYIPPPTASAPPPNYVPPPVNNIPPVNNPAPVISNPPAPVISNPPAPVVSNPPAPVVSNPPAPVISNPPAPAVSNPPAPAVSNPPAPAVSTPQPLPPISNPPPPVGSTAVAPGFQPPLGKEWSEINNPMPTQAVPCSGPACTSQQYIPMPPPSYEDCTVTRSCVQTNPPLATGTTGTTPVAPAPLSPTITPATPLPPVPTKQVIATPLPPPLPTPQAPPGCDPIQLTGKPVSDKLDILLVMDTSASMRGGHENGVAGELGMIIPEMSAFVDQLDPNTDVRIGMLLGHARATSKSPGNVHGKLYKVDAGDPAVIEYTKIRKSCQGSKQAMHECVTKNVAAILAHKLKDMPNDHTDAEGEALFSSLYDAVTDKSLREAIHTQGLFRDDATLGVITFSDEQEVCFDYAAAGIEKPSIKYHDPKTGKEVIGPDPHEIAFYNNECKTLANGAPMSAGKVWDALQALKNGDTSKLVVMGVHYLDNETIPKDLRDAQMDQEMGHGYIELGKMASGRTADMALVDRKAKVISFTNQLQYLGKYASMKMQFPNVFSCSSYTHPDAVNLTSVQLKIHDSVQNRDVALFSGQCVAGQPCTDANGKVINIDNRSCNGDLVGAATSKIAVDAHGKNPGLIVTVNPDELTEALEACGFKRGQVQIEFSTLSGVNAATGGAAPAAVGANSGIN